MELEGTHTQHHHQPVLLQPAIEALNIQKDGIYIDATYGRGGHSREILERLSGDGQLIAYDKDPQACDNARDTLGQDGRFSITHSSFMAIKKLLEEDMLSANIAGIIFDLGISSPQLNRGRGFSFQDNQSLDMRMDTATGISAVEWINSARADEIARVLKDFGEEKNAKKIAQLIVSSRPLLTANQLATLVASMPGKYRQKHPATRTFLALRLFINNELEELEYALGDALRLLKQKGRLVVITFHSLEDRIVKRFIRDHSQARHLPLDLYGERDYSNVKLREIGKPQTPSEDEVSHNPRSRSARMRVAEKL